MSQITTIEDAARLARAIASDIAIYNEEKIQRGLQNDQLFQELEGDLREGLRVWREKVAPNIVDGTNVLQKALVDTLFASAANIKSPIF